MSKTDAPQGYIYNLTSDQEYKMKEFYLAVMTVAGSAPTGIKIGGKPPAPEKKGGRFGFGAQTVTADQSFAESLKTFKEALQGMSPSHFKESYRTMVRLDMPDQLALRFLRARKWDVPRAVEMFGKTVYWRLDDFNINDLLEKGDVHYIKDQPDEGFINQYKVGKAVLFGRDKQGRPVVTIEAKKHDPRAQSEEAMRRYVLFCMEYTRLCLHGSVETALVIFDLGGFGLHNMDYAVVRFLHECFEAHYPESLGLLFIHRAPWIFGGVWNVIKTFLDPVVASKISFTKSDKDLLKHIDSSELTKELGGTLAKEYKWIPPTDEENSPLLDTETRDKLLQERGDLFNEFDEITLEWIKADGEAAKQLYSKRDKLCHRIQENYWKSDPYLRARCIYDRDGTFAKFREELAPGGIAQPILTLN